MSDLFGNPRFRIMRLEDGEQVVRLAGGPKSRSGWPSDKPHAGMWGGGVAYLLMPSVLSPERRFRAMAEQVQGLKDRSGDKELLVTGPTASILSLLESGPSFCRARLKRAGGDASHLAAYRFPAAQGAE